MRARLNIAGVDVAFMAELPVSINMSVADIRDPGKRNSHYTKTIVIPGTGPVNQIFEWAFEMNVKSNTFNPNQKIDAKYFVNEVKVYDGKLQLLRIKKVSDGAGGLMVKYECSIVGETGNLFLDIANGYLHDLDLSDLDHTFQYSSGLFNPTLGTGYCYPFIDYGVEYTGAQVEDKWTFEHLKPAVFAKEYLDRIFDAAGYSYTSSFFTSTHFKSLIIPDVNEGALQMNATTVNNNQFQAAQSSRTGNMTGTYNASFSVWEYSGLYEVARFDTDSGVLNNFYKTGDTVHLSDPGGKYNTGTFVFDPTITCTQTIYASVSFRFNINEPAGAATMPVSGFRNIRIGMILEESNNSGASWSPIAYAQRNVEILQFTAQTQFYKADVGIPPTLITANKSYRVIAELANVRFQFRDASNLVITSGTTSIDWEYKGHFGNTITAANLPTGGTVEMNSTIPRDVKQLDFLTSLIKMENLYIERDPANPTNYIIEPREDFIQTSSPLNWTDKLDTSKEQVIRPMGELDTKRYIWTYKSDKDYFNDLYEKEFKEVYGTKILDVDSDFQTSEKKIEVVFSATPSSNPAGTNGGMDVVVPRFWTGVPSAVKPTKCNIRILYWGGLLPCDTYEFAEAGYWDPASGSYTSPNDVVRMTEYPFAGHVNDPISPTIDLNFDFPKKVFWQFPHQTFTDNHRYNARYSKFIGEITHRDSKILLAYLVLNERDISEFTFRKQVFIDGTYYFVNEIKDFDPHEHKSIPVELLKLIAGDPFTATSGTSFGDQFGGGGSGTQLSLRTGSTYNTSGNYGPGPSYGTNNTNNSIYTLVIGNGNYIG